MTTLTKIEAAKLLGIGLTTLKKRMREGTVKFTRTAAQSRPGERTVYFTYEDLGMVEVLPTSSDIAIAPQYDDPAPELVRAHKLCTREQSPLEAQQEADRRFAEAYYAGEATDSAGNFIDGTNRRFPGKGSQTLLGPVEDVPRTIADTQNHMRPELQGTSRTISGSDGETVAHAGSDNHPLNSAFRTDAHRKAHAESLREWNRGRSGWDALSQSEQRQAIELSNARIHRAFPKAR
jgi:hypothetical protein